MAQDVRFAVRQVARAPGFTIVVLVTLALGIGANTAMFGAIDNILLKPLPYSDADRIVTLWQTKVSQGVERDDASPANFLDWRERNQSFEVLAAAEPYTMDHVGPDGPERFRTWLVTEGFFDVFGLRPALGRTFLDAEHQRGSQRVAVIGYRIWQTRFGGEPGAVGRVISLDGEPTIIVGVMPPAFDYPRGRDVWVPRVPLGSETNARGSTYWQVVGKLRAGVTPERAQAEFDGIARRLADEYPTTNAGTGVALVRLTDHLVGDVRPALMLLWLGVGFVLLIACFNVANLLLARTMRRRRELALLGVMVGAGVAALASRLLSRFLYGIGPLDVPTFGGIAVLLLAVTALACWLPARRAARTDPMISLRAE